MPTTSDTRTLPDPDPRTSGVARGLGEVHSSGRAHDEAGAVLVLALVFLLIVGGVVGVLANWTTNDLNNTAKFTAARSLQSAANSATQVAIQSIRYTPLLSPGQTLNASPPSPCWTNGPGLPSIDGQSMDVWCSTAWNPTSSNTRIVTFSTCLSSVASAAACAAQPLLQAVVTFDDYPAGIVSSPTSAQCVVYCGTGMTVNSWTWSPTLPTVTGINTTTGPITGGTSVTITGTGFVSGATSVNFVEGSVTGLTPSSTNVVLHAIPSSVTSTAVSVTTPSVTAGTTYFVTVTSPSGTSAYSSNAVFTFTSVVPSVTSLGSGPTGSTAGGTAITITGNGGFFSGAVVEFVEQSDPSVEFPSPSVTVNSSASITAVAPAVTSPGAYYVTVSIPSGLASPTTYTSAQSQVFTYSTLVPTVSGVTANYGPVAGGTSVTINGTGFVIGATVTLIAESSGVPNPLLTFSATNVTVTGPTTITATTPPVTTATTYFVTVTIPTGQPSPTTYTSSGGPVFTYS